MYRLNDIILSVNGVPTVNVTHAGAVDALKRAGYTVDLVCPSSNFLSHICMLNYAQHDCNFVLSICHTPISCHQSG